ncbi:MAG TPA: tRNA glutamyl-Q(34) synthetase GluQRS [Ottowia sp.]|nr:tRNA glutamyl-Q(34) synthetase GluQRS [Ottowia sp.]
MAATGEARPERPYRGRFAPSPTGPLHAGSLVAALASWLDARAHQGRWLVRIEDVDTPRCVAGADQALLGQLAACGLVADEAVVWQSQRGALYQQALDRLVAQGLVYPCACSRSDIEAAWARQGVERGRHTELVYPGTCRRGLQGRAARAWRLNTQIIQENDRHPGVERSSNAIQLIANTPSRDGNGHPALIGWQDRRLGPREQDVSQEVGDFVLKRADGLWAYQLAVVVDDADQGITDVVRGEDLADNTPRQILLQRALGLPTPRYLHTPLVLGANGEKLSKQNGAPALDVTQPLDALNAAAAVLGLAPGGASVGESLARWVNEWAWRVSEA